MDALIVFGFHYVTRLKFTKSFRMSLSNGARKYRSSKKGNKNLSLCHYGPTNTYTVQSPIGYLFVVSCPKGLHSLAQEKDASDKNFAPDLHCQVKHISKKWEDNGYMYKPAILCINWLTVYFSDPQRIQACPTPPFCSTISAIDGSFQKKVWEKLTKCVPPGETISYGSLAKLVDGENSGAAQAVGTAMRRNPLQIIVPCHRVIKSDGSIGHYKGGTGNSIKIWLLKHEGHLSQFV